MISAGAHIPLMQDVTTTTLVVGMILGTSIAMWAISHRAGWLAIAASSFIFDVHGGLNASARGANRDGVLTLSEALEPESVLHSNEHATAMVQKHLKSPVRSAP